MVPPWVPAIPSPPQDEAPPEDQSPEDATTPPTTEGLPQLAPAARFMSSRLNLGRFASSGDTDNLRRGVGHYFKTGYGGGRGGGGGSGSAVKRFGGTATTAGALYGVLSPAPDSERTPERDSFEQACRAASPPEVLVTALVEVLRPIDGTQDAEAERKSLAEAMSEFLTVSPNADLLGLTESQRLSIVARYVALDVYRRLFLDVGQSIIDNAPTIATGLSRMREAKEYIREKILAAFGRLSKAAGDFTSKRIVSLVGTALSDAISVFESYTE